MGYNLFERSAYLNYVGQQRWSYRKIGEVYPQSLDANPLAHSRKKIIKVLTQNLIKYFNLQVSLCSRCGEKKF